MYWASGSLVCTCGNRFWETGNLAIWGRRKRQKGTFRDLGTYRLNRHSTVHEAGCVKMSKAKETSKTFSPNNISKKLRLTESPEDSWQKLGDFVYLPVSVFIFLWVSDWFTICESKKMAHFWIPDWGWILFSSPRMIELPNRPSNKLPHLALSGPYIFYALMLL